MLGRNAIWYECEEGMVSNLQDEAKNINLIWIYLLYLKIILCAYNFQVNYKKLLVHIFCL